MPADCLQLSFSLLHRFPETRWTICLFLSYPSVMTLSRASAFQGSVANSGPGGLCCKDFALVADHLREDEITSQATAWNSPAMNSACALMSLPPMFRTCPFLIIAIAS